MLEPGNTAPKFTLPTNGEATVTLPNGKPIVLFFYPKDDTPGCTTEAIGFTDRLAEFQNLGIDVVGLSPDTAKKHDKFIEKHSLKVTLVADEEKAALESYGVWKEKSMYGKTYMGVERSTFLIDAEGKIIEIWRKVRVKGHVDAVFDAAQKQFG